MGLSRSLLGHMRRRPLDRLNLGRELSSTLMQRSLQIIHFSGLIAPDGLRLNHCSRRELTIAE